MTSISATLETTALAHLSSLAPDCEEVTAQSVDVSTYLNSAQKPSAGDSSRRREIARPGRLLAPLLRLYNVDDEGSHSPPRQALVETTPADAKHRLAIGLIETVFEVSELDPLPFINRR